MKTPSRKRIQRDSLRETDVIRRVTSLLAAEKYRIRHEVPNMGQSVDIVGTKGSWVTFVEAKVRNWRCALRQCVAHEQVADFICIAVAMQSVSASLIAEIENEVVGTVALRGRWEAAPEIPSPWIGGLFVVPQHRGQGIGKALVEAATGEAVAAGQPIVHMAIRVDPGSYIRRGWRVVGTVFSGDESVTVLRLETGS